MFTVVPMVVASFLKRLIAAMLSLLCHNLPMVEAALAAGAT
jgi:hypothetical protein